MKKCLFLMLMFISMNVMGQKSYKVFCELVGTGKFMSNKVTVVVDFGQKTNFWSGASKQYLVDDEGKKIDFNSMVDAMNYMSRRGWVFEQAYVVTANKQNVYHWLLSKDVSQDEIIDEGFITKQNFEETGKHKVSNNKEKKSRIIRDDIYN